MISNFFSNFLLEQMKSHNSCMCVIFLNVSFHVYSQIACLNRCKVTIVACLRFVCHKIVHVLLCSGGFSVAPLSLFIKWLWPNYFEFSIYTNRLKPSAQAKYIDLDQKSICQLRWPKSTRSIVMSRQSQMQTVCLFFQQTFQVENPRDGSQRKEAFCLCTVQLLLQ